MLLCEFPKLFAGNEFDLGETNPPDHNQVTTHSLLSSLSPRLGRLASKKRSKKAHHSGFASGSHPVGSAVAPTSLVRALDSRNGLAPSGSVIWSFDFRG